MGTLKAIIRNVAVMAKLWTSLFDLSIPQINSDLKIN